MSYEDYEPLKRIKTPAQVKANPPSQNDFKRYDAQGWRDYDAEYYLYVEACNKFYRNYCDEKEKAMNQCKSLYQKLQEALSVTLVYIVSYEHAIESFNYSIKQSEKAYEKMQLIKDSNVNEPKEKTLVNIEASTKAVEVMTQKKSDLESLSNVLNELSAKVVELNNIWDKDYYMPVY